MATTAQILAQIKARESGGYANPYSLTPQQNVDYPNSHASGAYQIEPATWTAWTNASGIGTQYDQAYQAPASVQDAVAAYAVNNYGANLSSTWAASAPAGGYSSVTEAQDPSSFLTASDSSGISSYVTADTGSGSATTGDGSASFSTSGDTSYVSAPEGTSSSAWTGVVPSNPGKGLASISTSTNSGGIPYTINLQSGYSFTDLAKNFNKTIANVGGLISGDIQKGVVSGKNAVLSLGSGVISGAEDFMIRGGLMLFGAMLVVGVLAALVMKTDTGQRAVAAGARVAAA